MITSFGCEQIGVVRTQHPTHFYDKNIQEV